ncbi:MAG: alpha/beta fold hydrolase [Candidatus Margulisiibacteriota bacterium]
MRWFRSITLTSQFQPTPSLAKSKAGRQAQSLHECEYLVKTPGNLSFKITQTWTMKSLELNREPVILCSGLAHNREIFALGDDGRMGLETNRSLKNKLALADFNVFSAELLSEGKKKLDFDNLLFNHVPAFIDFVRKVTGHDQVHWAGFSMGSMMIYAYMASARNFMLNKLKSITAICSPFFLHPEQLSKKLLRAYKWAFLYRPLVNYLGYASKLPLKIKKKSLKTLGNNTENMNDKVVEKIFSEVLEGIPRGLLDQFKDWAYSEDFRSNPGWAEFEDIEDLDDSNIKEYTKAYKRVLERTKRRYSYRYNMGFSEIPMFFIAGERDGLAPPETVKSAFDATRHKQHPKELTSIKGKGYIGKQRGNKVFLQFENLGHLDTVLTAKVQSHIEKFLIEHSTENASVNVNLL